MLLQIWFVNKQTYMLVVYLNATKPILDHCQSSINPMEKKPSSAISVMKMVNS